MKKFKLPSWFHEETDTSVDTPVDEASLRAQIVERLRTILDPEIPVNIYDLGLIYDLEIDNNNVLIKMTLTAPGCPVAQTFPNQVAQRVREVAGVNACEVELVWDPPWDKSLLSEAARVQLGMF